MKLALANHQAKCFSSIIYKEEPYYSVDQVLYHYFTKPKDFKISKLLKHEGSKDYIEYNNNIKELFLVKKKKYWVANLPGMVSILMQCCEESHQTKILLDFLQNSNQLITNHCCTADSLNQCSHSTSTYTPEILQQLNHLLNDSMDIGGLETTSDSSDQQELYSKSGLSGTDLTCFEETDEDIDNIIREEMETETEYNNSIIRAIEDEPTFEVDTQGVLDNGSAFQMSDDEPYSDYNSQTFCSSVETCPTNLGEFILPLDPIPSKFINLEHYFSCSNISCGSTKIKPIPRKWADLKEKEQFSRYEQRRCVDILKIIEQLFGTLGHDQSTWFSCLLSKTESKKTILEILKKSLSESEWKQVLKDSGYSSIINNPSSNESSIALSDTHENDILYFKDNNLLSFLILHNLRKECNLMHLTNTTKLRKVKTKFDESIEKYISSISNDYKGHMIDLEFAIKRILLLYKLLGGKSINKKKIFFKLSVDGRTINGNKQVAVALVPLNLRDIFPTQSVLSVFYIGLFLMSESEDSIQKTIGTISDKIKQVNESKFDDESNVKLIYVSDMHNVGLTFDFDLCPFCDAKEVSDLSASTRTTISGYLPFEIEDIFMCNLHIKQRLVENLIAYIASSSQHKELILKNMRSIKGLDTFNYREYVARYNDHGIATTSTRSCVRSSMLSGEQCNTVLNNYTKIIYGVAKETYDKYEKLFTILNNIIIIIEMKQDDSDETQILTDDHIDMLDKLIIEFLKIAYSIWAKGVKSHYFHYIIHLPSMMKRLKEMEFSLAMISNQGFERSHLSHHAVFTRVMNNGGGKSRIPITKQLIQWQWRKVELAIDLYNRKSKTYWGEKKIKNRTPWDEDKKAKSLNLLKFNNSVTYDTNGTYSTLIKSIKDAFDKAEEKERIEKENKKRTLEQQNEISNNTNFIMETKKTQTTKKSKKF